MESNNSLAVEIYKKRHQIVLTSLMQGHEVTVNKRTYAIFKPGQQIPLFDIDKPYTVEAPHYCLVALVGTVNKMLFEGWLLMEDMPLVKMCSEIDLMSADELIEAAASINTKNKLAIRRTKYDAI